MDSRKVVFIHKDKHSEVAVFHSVEKAVEIRDKVQTAIWGGADAPFVLDDEGREIHLNLTDVESVVMQRPGSPLPA